MTIRNVPGSYSTIANAVAAAKSGDTIVVASGYAGNEAVAVAVNNLTVNAPADVAGIWLNVQPNVTKLTLTGTASIRVAGFGVNGFTFLGGDGNETFVTSSTGNDIFDGGGGNDTLDGGLGTNTLIGGAGDDLFIVNRGAGTIDGGTGTDTIRGANFGFFGQVDMTGYTFQNVEVLDASAAVLSLAQLNAFTTLTDSDSTSSTLIYKFREAGGVFDFSTRLPAGHAVQTLDQGLTSGVTLTGTNLNDILAGASGFGNTLNGGTGDDFLTGGAGNDILDGGVGNDTLIGDAGNNILKGEDGNDKFGLRSIAGGTVDGGAGVDTVTTRLFGANVRAILGSYSFIDVEVLDSRAVSGSIAQLSSFATLSDSSSANSTLFYALSGSGGSFDFSSHVVAGHAVSVADNGLLSGVDLTGTALHDTLYGAASFSSTLMGGAGDDRLYGGSAGDTLYGGSGADRIDGGAGGDTLDGGDGNDVYFVDSLADVVSDSGVGAGGGVDSVYSLVDFTIQDSQSIENLHAAAGAGALALTGDTANNIIIGGNGGDTLDGGSAGDDALYGGLGDDSYIVSHARVGIRELAGAGHDSVQSSVDFTLSANVEDLTLTAAAAKGYGNGIDNTITGNDAANILKGGGGNDTLVGALGSERLYGGSGADHFVLTSLADSGLGAARDVIKDFSQVEHDLVDFSAIQAVAGASIDQAFTFIGSDPFTHQAGQLHQYMANGLTVVEGDVNGDAKADFQIALQGAFTLTATNFVL
jgi:Ca2+-binding RTX toxin-like protein